MNKKLIAHILVITILIIVGAVVVSLTSQKPESTPPVVEDGNGTDVIIDNGKEPEVITSDIDTSDWLTYRNEEFGFEFRYPREWGHIEELPDINQIRIMETESKFTATISVNECTKNCINKESKFAVLTNGFNGCEIGLWHLFYRNNNQEIVIGTGPTSRTDINSINITEDKCLELLASIDKKRVELGPGGQSVELTETEIPEEGRKAYNIFTAMINSFKEL